MSKPNKRPFETSWDIEEYCSKVCAELATVTGTLMGELEYGLQQPTQSSNSLSVALAAAEQLRELTQSLRLYATQLGPHQATDLASTLLECVDRAEREHPNVSFEVEAESPNVGALPGGVLGQLLRSLLSGLSRSLPPQSKVQCHLSGTEDRFDFRFEFQSANGQLNLEDELSLETARTLTHRLGGKILWEPWDKGAKVHLQFPKQNAPTESFDTQRTSQRVAVTLPVTVTLNGHAPVATHLRVLSRRGAYLLYPTTDPRPERDWEGDLRVHYLGGQSIHVPKVRVASCLWSGSEPGIGLEFLRLDAKAECILEALIRCHGKS